MKNVSLSLVFLALFLLISAALSAQNNLQFNQVLLVDSLRTVPTGKTWKIESVMAKTDLQSAVAVIGTGGSGGNSQFTSIIVNSTTIYMSAVQFASQTFAYGVSYAFAVKDLTKLPIWLPAGATLKIGTNVNYISIIEYNLVP